MITKVYIDIDGVLANFRAQCEKYNCINGTKVDWQIVKMHSPEFWEEIDWIDGGKEFYSWLRNLCNEEDLELYACTVVNFSDGKIGRMNWIKKQLGLDRHHIIIVNHGNEKAFYSEQNAVLIDDFKKNCDEFLKYGGQVIRFTSYIKTKDELLTMLQ